MSFLTTALIGLVVGAIAKFLMPGRQGGGIIVTALLGFLGSVVATFAGQMLGFYRPGATAGFIASIFGAIIVLWLYGRFGGKRRS
ncbi:MAG: GlsB/YeaQ/YmgE family stress response membrane protein [Burkholderiaceae bacterium]|nr:GlsB/YeaQ/YmgE family stress response membrane protein [Burkholderiaceae bacterium]